VKLERMDDFFTLRVDEYEHHMLTIEDVAAGYIKMVQILPDGINKLLDLGCGTGLELDEIFKRFPNLSVTGIDLTPKMLEQLERKHRSRKLNLICDNYLNTDFGCKQFDAVISFETMHHFSHLQKLQVYKNIHKALCEGGVYVECDYMVETKEQENFFFAELEKLKNEQQILSESELYHYDTPTTFETQCELLNKAEFTNIQQVFKQGCTVMFIAR
jgi:SAM-dependent methyltransferase